MAIITEEKTALPKPNYKYITNEEDARTAMSFLDKYNTIAIDTEATALDPFEAKWSLLQIGVPDHAFVFDVRYDTEHSSLHPEVLDPILKDKSKIKLLQNASYDMKLIKLNRGFYLTNVYDTMIAEQLSYLGMFVKASLEALVSKYLGLATPKEPRLTFRIYDQKFEPFQLEYAANDVVPLHHIRDSQLIRIKKENLERALDLELRFLKPLCEMELNGILIDVEKWRLIMKGIEYERDDLRKVIHNILGEVEDQTTLFGGSNINIDSTAQLGKALAKFGLEMTSTGVEALNQFKGVPVIDALLDYRKANKLISTYAEPLLNRINKYTGRLHTDFKQMVATGRLSSSHPNLQNIPKQQKYRSCFIAKDGYSLITADMSNCELRILGNISKDPVFIEAYATGQDIHTRTASEMFGVPYDKVDKSMRNAAKSINFGLCTSENTSIISNSGIKAIPDVNITDIIAHDCGEDEVIDVSFMGEKEVFEVITKYGYSIEVTAEHLMKVIDESGDYTDKRLKDINVKTDYVCLKKESNVFPTSDYIFDAFNVKKNTNYKHFDLPTKVTKEWAAFLGLFVAEGSLSKVKNRKKYGFLQCGFSTIEMEFIGYIDKLLRSLFGDRLVRVPKKDKIYYGFSSVLFGEWLATICDVKDIDKTKEIRVPKCVKRSTKVIQIEFLRWLFEGDGSVKKNGNGFSVTYSSKSYKLVKDLQIMLLNFGILSSVRAEGREKYPGENYYELRLVGEKSRQIFVSEIGFLSGYKNNKCIDNFKMRESTWFLPNQSKRTKNILKTCGLRGCDRKLLYDVVYNILNNTKGVGDIQLEKLYEYDDFFKFIYENDIVPLPIKSIKSKGIKKVYDLSVENHQYFLANGFVVHNCYGMSAVGLAARLKINKREAEGLIEKYFKAYTKVKQSLDASARFAVMNRYSMSIIGRRRYYNMPPYDHPDRNKIQRGIQRQGMNMPIQAANADVVKEAMVLLVEQLKPYDAKLLLSVHDEVVVEVVEEQKQEVMSIVSNSLIDGFAKHFSIIQMETDVICSPCWTKSACENKVDGKKCGHNEMKFVPHPTTKTQLVCSKCGAKQD